MNRKRIIIIWAVVLITLSSCSIQKVPSFKVFKSSHFGGYSFEYPAYLKLGYHQVGKLSEGLGIGMTRATNETQMKEQEFIKDRFNKGESIWLNYKYKKRAIKVRQYVHLLIADCNPSMQYPYINRPRDLKIMNLDKDKIFIYRRPQKTVPGNLIGYGAWLTRDGLGISAIIHFKPDNKEFNKNTLIEILKSIKKRANTSS